jgi:hypothetical protein
MASTVWDKAQAAVDDMAARCVGAQAFKPFKPLNG